VNLVSIVIPMYNEELNIESCIKVLRDQKNQKFDVIFIDDGSTDNTVDRLNEFLNSEVSFNYKVIQQDNMGAAEARKTGINYSSTEFIMILDCDDLISANFIDEIYRVHNKYEDVDIILPDLYIEAKNNDFNKFDFYTDAIQLNSTDCVNHSLDGWKVHGFMTIRKRVINLSYQNYNICNPENNNYINNDEVITRFNFSNSRVILRSEAKYFYCYNSSSTTKKINKNKFLMIKNAMIINNYYSTNSNVKINTYNELVAVVWGTHIYMHKNKKHLTHIYEWKRLIGDSVKEMKYFGKIGELTNKKKIQLTLLKLLYKW